MKRILRRLRVRSSYTREEYITLEKSKVDWEGYARSLPFKVGDPIEHFLEHFERHPLVIPGWFDSHFYLESNPDVRLSGENPLVHFLRYGCHEGRPGVAPGNSVSPEAIGEDTDAEQPSPPNSPSETSLKDQLYHLLLENGVIDENFDPKLARQWVGDLLEVSKYGGVRIEGFFDQAFYRVVNPDVGRAPVNELQHFIQYGYSEGRIAWVDVDAMVSVGGNEKDELKRTVMVVSHDTTATGAPAVALKVARRLSEKFNVITASLGGGALHTKFVETGIFHFDAPRNYGIAGLAFCLDLVCKRQDISAVILNSVESVDLAVAAASLGLPTVCLLHEFADYTRPVGKIARALLTCDLVVYPAESLAHSGLRELEEMGGVKHKPNHLRIQPQGYLGFQSEEKGGDWSLRKELFLSDDDLLVVGAGHIQPRKGVDWFLQTCYQLQKYLREMDNERAERLQFVWLGSGYDENDVVVSVWLDAYAHRVGIADRVHFPGPVHDVGAALNEASLFLLTSRLDPFPNVAVDALNADCGLGVFRDASGIADFVEEHGARAVIGDYGDPNDLAHKVAVHFDYLVERDGRNARICRQELDFEHYVDNLVADLEESIARKAAIRRAAETEIFRERFDPDFYSLSFHDEGDRAEHFLSLLHKGIAQAKPFPGSDIQRVLDEIQGKEMAFPELVEKALTIEVESMPVHRLVGTGDTELFSGRIALQFHVYFADLIPEYCTYFRLLEEHDVDLFVSHVPELAEDQIEQLEASVPGKLHLRKVDNCGRNVYPFHLQFCEEIVGQYDLVGHFHTKKSSDIADGIGDRWRRYLLANLIGSPNAIREIFDRFKDERIGLVFAEDSHLSDEGKNGRYIEELLKPLGQTRWPHYRHFPLGTMFWARVSALESMTQWPLHTFDILEPVPYDGSLLHAFERLLPQLVMAAGYEVQRVYTAGTRW